MDEDALEDDLALRARVGAARPELDALAVAVQRAAALAALFGTQTPVRIGRYELVRALGKGGGGAVFVARDRELGRDIAIKLLAASGVERTRALAEGQALARLSHPNIVPVFDVGTDGDRVYLAMELVRGDSLRVYAARATRREVVAAYRQAGEGLAAAHAAGLVHRDFKPDNAVIGADGRVRVIDFGLARSAGDEPISESGTPGYISPEQKPGAAASPAGDQYAFGVALREGCLAAGRPGEPLPAWLDAIVRRATRVEPAQRYPAMAALLRALADDPRRRWRRRAIVAVPVALALGAFQLGRGDVAPVVVRPRCDGGAAALAPVWSAARSAQVRAHLGGLGTAYAASSSARAGDALDGYGARWAAAHDAACVAARSESSTTMIDRRAACLASARNQLDALAGVVLVTDGAGVPAAMRALTELPDLDRCADAAALITDIAGPAAAQAAGAAALAAELERVTVHIEAAQPAAAERAATAAAAARALAYRPLLARALLARGRAELTRGHHPDASPLLAEAADHAIAVGDLRTAVEAHARWLLAELSGDPPAALAGVRPFFAMAERLGPHDRPIVALLHNHAGVLANATGDMERARREFRAALRIAREVSGPGTVELAWARTNLALVTADPAERAALHAEAVTVARELGDEHPFVLEQQMMAALGLADVAAARAALRAPCTRFAELHRDRLPLLIGFAYELLVLDLLAGDTGAMRASATLVRAATPGAYGAADYDALATAVLAWLDGDLAGATAKLAELAHRTRPDAGALWHQLLVPADVEAARAAIARAAGRSRDDAAATARADALLERAAAVSPNSMITLRRAGLRGGPAAP
jgi:eukaryotic-like serine/threonine-protein kinase